VQSLVESLRTRGVELELDGPRLRWRAPKGTVTAADLAALREAKAALLQVLAREVPEPRLALEESPATQTRERLGAALIRSPRFGEVWVVLDPCALPELEAEETARPEPRPILLAEDVARLRGKSETAIRAALEVARAFPGSRVVQ
jgi:hypothetical protein